MSLALIHEVWKVIRPSIEAGEVDEAADTLVNYLVDHDYDPAEIKSTFKRDPAIQSALSFFTEKIDVGSFNKEEDMFSDDEDEYEEDDDDDDEW